MSENMMQSPGGLPPYSQSIQAPSLYRLACPYCGANSFRALGKKGAMGKSIGVYSMLGAVGNLIADSNAKQDYSFVPTNYKCMACGKKFESAPLLAQPDELLALPCTVAFHRKGSFVGMAVAQYVWLNGVKVGPVHNGKTIEFPVWTRYNIVFVTDQFGVAFKGNRAFEAAPGGRVEIEFNRSFK